MKNLTVSFSLLVFSNFLMGQVTPDSKMAVNANRLQSEQ